MSDRDDAPPAEAVDVMARITCSKACDCYDARLHPICEGVALAKLRRLRTLPDAARWRLAAWIVAGLEPTREMVEACSHARVQIPLRDSKGRSAASIKAALAAAREAGDAE